MKRHLVSLAGLALGLSLVGTVAHADGWTAPRNYAPERACGAGPFSGFYVGAAVGGAQQRSEITDVLPLSTTFGQKFKDRDSSVTFGGYTGYNWQCNNWVFGAETDFNYINSSPNTLADTTSLESQMNWFGTLRGRAGFVVHESLLLYGTAGLAYAQTDHKFSDSALVFSQSNDDTRTGWTVGGGGELLHDNRWLLRAEALYVDLGDETHNYTATGGGCPTAVCTAAAKWDDNFWVARLGVTYKFGEREEVVPLK